MQKQTSHTFSRLTAALLAVGALLGSAQAAIDLKANQQPIHAPQNPEAIAKIPADFKFAEPGTLTVGVAVGTPPLVSLADDNKTIIGTEPDIARLVADSLGLKLKLVTTSWEDWPLGVQSGRYDAFITNVTVTKERKTKFDFASYRIDTLGFYVKSTSKIQSIKEPKDIAGLKIIVGSGTNQEAILLQWDKQNQAAGLKAIQPVYVTDSAAGDLLIQSGRADATFGPNVTAAYKAALNGKTRLVGLVNGGYPHPAPLAVTLRKGTGLVNAVQTALNGVIQSGQYDQVLKRWGDESERIEHSEINPLGLGDARP